MRRTKRTKAPSRSRSVTPMRKKANFNKPIYNVPRTLAPRTGLGTFKVVKMIYSEKAQINATDMAVGGTSYYQFRLNSVHDPNLTGTGHQPSAHDQLAPLFEQYCVTKCDFRVSFMNVGINGYICGYYITDTDSVATNATTLIEQGLVQWKQLGPVAGGHGVQSFSGTVDLPALMGLSYQQYVSSPQYQTVFGFNPGDVGFLTLFGTSVLSESPEAIPFTVELTYTVRLQGTQLVAES